MKKLLAIIIIMGLITTGCSTNNITDDVATNDNQLSSEPSAIVKAEEVEETTVVDENSDYDEINQTFSDWILGTEYKIEAVNLNAEEKTIEIVISDDNYASLAEYDEDDIVNSLDDILRAYNMSDGFVMHFSNGETLNDGAEESADSEDEDEPTQEVNNVQAGADGDRINLIFIHHSVGENWLNAGLNEMLNDSNIHVADTYYGWHEMGDRTDTSDWPDWFNDDVMPTVYNEIGNMTGYNSIEPADGENTIVMFKSCYPNSDVGNSIDDEKEIYLSLLEYFSQHPDKMFVLITSPPMQRISHSDKTRELANWLVASDGWRSDYTGNNLFVFDFYNVLTAENNHHMLVDGVEEHIINDGSNTLHYDSAGDDHPSDEGSLKAAEEFVPLLMYWYKEFVK